MNAYRHFVIVLVKEYTIFGSGKHYDVISFIEQFYQVSFLEAIEILSREFGVSLEDKYETQKIVERLKKEQEDRAKIELKLKENYNNIYGKMCELYKEWANLEEEFSSKLNEKNIYVEIYKVAIDNTVYLDYITEYVKDAEEVEIYKRRGEMYEIIRRFDILGKRRATRGENNTTAIL